MIDNLPEYVKLNNAYNPAHYPANKKISAEEWNALWLSVMYQGNHQEDVLASILNVTIPENIDNINNLINITSTHTSLLAGLRTDVDSNTSRIDSLESYTIDLNESINNLDSITANHKGRIDTLENTDINHNNRISSLEDTADDHETRVNTLETDVNTLKEDIPLKAYLSEVYRHYSLLSPLPSDIVYIREGRKTLYIEFSPETHTIVKSDGQAESITGSIIALALLPHINSSYTIQREIFRCEYGEFVRHIVLNKTTWSVITVGEWQVLNSDWYNKLDLGLDIERARIDTIMQDYDTITSVNAKVSNVQTQVTSNRTDINNLLGDYVRKQDNTGVTYLTQSFLEVSDTGALVHLENLKQIGNTTASTSRQTTPIPVVDNKARLFLPQEISTLRNLESWKESLLGEALNYIVDFSDMPSTPTSEQLQTYLNNKWASIGGTTPILDQTTMVDPNIPLSYKWFVNSNAWVFFQGSIEGKATNNIYDEVTGELLTTGALGKVVGSNKHFYAMIETNGEIAINGLDALEEEVGNNSSDIAELQEDLSDQTTALSNHMSNISNPHSVAFSQLLNKPTTLAEYGITDAAAKLSIGQWHVPYRDEAGPGEPNTSRLATMTSPLPIAILIRDAEGKATFVGGTSANQGIVKSQLDAVQGNVDTVQSNLNTHTGNTDIHVTTADKTLWNNKVDKVEGKQLSTEDYTSDEKDKLTGIAEGAQVNPSIVQTTGQSETAIMSQKAVSDELKTCERIQNYVIFESDAPRTITPKYTQSGITLQYSIDKGVSWVNISHNTATPSSAEIWFRGQATGNKGLFVSDTTANAWSFSGGSTNKLRVEGNLNYLLCDNLGDISAPTTLADYCYLNMFLGCTSLTKAPDLPATTLADYCYSGMFRGCTSLTKAPDLPATTLRNACYLNMFLGCTSLTQIKCYYPSDLYINVALNWLNGINTTGILYSPNGIITYGRPTNWTSQDLTLSETATIGDLSLAKTEIIGDLDLAKTEIITETIGKIYPIGAIYISTVNTSPASFLGGRWTQLSNTFLYATTGTSLQEGGSATHTLTVAELPSHNHSGATDSAGAGNTGSVNGTITGIPGSGTTTGFISYTRTSSSIDTWGSGNSDRYTATLNHSHTMPAHTHSITAQGSGTAHNNMPPYTTVYMWRRTP